MLQAKGKLKFRSLSQQSFKTSLPVLNRPSREKPSFSMAKIQLDAKPLSGHKKLRSQDKEIFEGLQHKKPKIPIKNSRTTLSNFFKFSKTLHHDKNSEKQQKQDDDETNGQYDKKDKGQQKIQHALCIGNAKISSKSTGVVKNYAVNSHPGFANSINEDRISIITNLNKIVKNTKKVSFFGIYGGKNGPTKAEYMRDSFHQILFHDQYLSSNTEEAIRRSFDQLEKNILYDPKFKTDFSSVSFIICIFIDETMFLIKAGQARAIFSMNLGSQVLNPQSRKVEKKEGKKPLNKEKVIFADIDVRRFEIDDTFDFVVLGSEGLFEVLTEKQIGMKVWEVALSQKHKNIHGRIGQACHGILNRASKEMGTKSISLILIGLPGFEKCLLQNDELQLPYTSKKG